MTNKISRFLLWGKNTHTHTHTFEKLTSYVNGAFNVSKSWVPIATRVLRLLENVDSSTSTKSLWGNENLGDLLIQLVSPHRAPQDKGRPKTKGIYTIYDCRISDILKRKTSKLKQQAAIYIHTEMMQIARTIKLSHPNSKTK